MTQSRAPSRRLYSRASVPSPHLVSLLWIFREFQIPNVHIHPICYFLDKAEQKYKVKILKNFLKTKQPFTERKWLKTEEKDHGDKGKNVWLMGGTDILKQG